jgi:ribonucleotide monophosphatase NagD (HAD superfamily)
MDSLLVLTGVSQLADVRAAAPEHRPTYVTEDLSGLFADRDRVTVEAALG